MMLNLYPGNRQMLSDGIRRRTEKRGNLSGFASHLFRTSTILAMVILFGFVGNASGQKMGTVSGVIVDAADDQPLGGVNVIVAGTHRGTTTNLEGEYSLKLPAGSYTIKTSFIGYISVEEAATVSAGKTVTLDFELEEGSIRFGESIVILGSKSVRTAVETTVPVDVIGEEEIAESGQSEVNQMLAFLAPSFNASHQTIADGTDQINPASLRGLGPDQVLVLVNGKRRHTSSLVHVNGTFGRGTVGVDLNTIPKSAIERIEILRDGAAAQYGSDAIAGVINIVLKEQTENIQVNSMVGTTGEGDGDQYKIDANYGFNIGDRGFFNVTGEFLDRGRTNRSGPEWPGDIFPGISGQAATDSALNANGKTRKDFMMKTGQGKATVGVVFFNSAVSLTDNAEFYTFGGISHRKGKSTGFYRLPNSEDRVVAELFPFGFLPEIHSEIKDRSVAFGLRGNRAGWDVDLSVTSGGNSFQFNIENTNNASMGTSSPLSFDAGTLVFNQTTGNLDLVRPIDTKGAVKSLFFATGGEFRVDNYQIQAGDDASWMLGNGGSVPGVDFDTTASGSPKASGSQVFPGFQPSNEVDRYRNSISIYGALESEVTEQLSADIGVRFENYSDFGNTVIGKIASRYEVIENFNLRGAVSTGFRAPSLHQFWFNNVSTQFVLDSQGELVPSRVLTSNNRSSVTKAFGIPDLKEETSINISGGFTARPHAKVSVTADYYYIKIEDRIVLTSRFDGSDSVFAKILEPFSDAGVGAAQFFSNAVDTKTQGVDIVVSYFTPLGDGKLDLTASANFTKTEVDKINIPQESIDLFEDAKGSAASPGELDNIANTLFNREEENRLETALPRLKGSFLARYSLGSWIVSGRASYFGEVSYKPTNNTLDEDFGAKTIVDASLTYKVGKMVSLTVGGDNVFNSFPDEHKLDANRSSERFIYSRRVTQFGTNGGFYYAKLGLKL